jgi:uncharacterized damage-inducible protein DinB
MRKVSLMLLVALVIPSAASQAQLAPLPVADVRSNWQAMSDFVLRSAIATPASKYKYRPTAGVRSLGELFAHVAGAQSMLCAIALGEKAPDMNAVTARTKPELVEALRASNRDCERAYTQDQAATSGIVDVFGTPHTRMYTLMMNAAHDAEHYGNIVTYMRMNKLVPPSSQPAK